MSDSINSIRISIRVSRSSPDELAKELADLAPYHRAKRLYLLASMGLALERGRLPTAVGGIQEPKHPSEVPQAASTKRSVEAQEVAVEDKPQTASEKYEPDFSDLWAAGVMAD